jgi:hypothetical protein
MICGQCRRWFHPGIPRCEDAEALNIARTARDPNGMRGRGRECERVKLSFDVRRDNSQDESSGSQKILRGFSAS